jgi:hypothetical protein
MKRCSWIWTARWDRCASSCSRSGLATADVIQKKVFLLLCDYGGETEEMDDSPIEIELKSLY